MTITYSNGTILEATVLTHDEQAIRAIAPGSPDVLQFTQLHGIWFSEELEPVTIEFAWQRRGSSFTPAEGDFICAKQLADKLIGLLFDESDGKQAKSVPPVLTQKATG